MTAALSAQPGTDRYFGLARAEMTVPGMAGYSQVYAYSGDASWGGHPMIAGSWYSGPGEAVVPTAFLRGELEGLFPHLDWYIVPGGVRIDLFRPTIKTAREDFRQSLLHRTARFQRCRGQCLMQ